MTLMTPKQRIRAFLADRSSDSASESQDHARPSVAPGNTPYTDPEAGRIARELVKLHRDGAIKSERDASFYANLIRDFGATYAGPPACAAAEHAPNLVPQPPRGTSPQERIDSVDAEKRQTRGNLAS